MPIRINSQGNSFKINTYQTPYVIANECNVKRGDLLHFNDDGESVTNKISGNDSIDAIALISGNAGDTIPCYVLYVKNTYGDLSNHTHEFLTNFTYGELMRSMKIHE